MTLRELQAMLSLYGAADAQTRRQALGLVPELGDFAGMLRTPARRWLLIASVDGMRIGTRTVVCNKDDLPVHEQDFARSYDLASGVTVTHRELSE